MRFSALGGNSSQAILISTNMQSNPPSESQRVYRVDKFRVPAPARAEFLERVRETHNALKSQPGLIQDFILEQTGGPGVFNIVTVAVWQDARAVDAAKTAMEEWRRSTGFEPKEMFSRLNIEADLANYSEVGV
jgi:heme-degrading monooxygenase HmoA